MAARTGVAQFAGSGSTKWKTTGSIPSQGTCLGCRFGPKQGCVPEATDLSLSLSISLSLSPAHPPQL